MTVHLVGAGPGDPELLTVRAARLLATADVVVHDRLVHPDVLDLAPAGAERIDVGKRPGATTPQELINALLVHLGDQGLEVVRLKGGDPFVFGRGGEEAEALSQAGVPFTVVTGHRATGGSTGVAWEALAAVGGTIVVLMGVTERAVIAERLIAGGLSPDTPVAAVRWGTRPDQTTVRTTLGALGVTEVRSPATIVIGAVAALDLAPTAASTTEQVR